MTTVELNAKKIEIFEILLNTDDETVIAKVMSYLRKVKAKSVNPPCQFTVEELKKRVEKAEKDIKAGRVIPHESISRKNITQ